jgi:hypothetical protein
MRWESINADTPRTARSHLLSLLTANLTAKPVNVGGIPGRGRTISGTISSVKFAEVRRFRRADGLLVLGAALYVVKRGPWLTGFAVLLALPVVVMSTWLAFDFDFRRQAIMAALSAVFYFYATGSLIAYMLDDDFATADELFAAGATFTLLAWAFAYVYLTNRVR